MMTGRIEVRLKRGVADPEGENTRKALRLLGYDQVAGVRAVRVFELDLDVESPEAAEELLEEMTRRLLANPVIHDHAVAVQAAEAASS